MYALTLSRDSSPPYCVRVHGRTHTSPLLDTTYVDARWTRSRGFRARVCVPVDPSLLAAAMKKTESRPFAALPERSRLSVAPSCIQPSKTEEHEGTFVLLCSVTVTAGYWEVNTAVKSGIFGKARFSFQGTRDLDWKVSLCDEMSDIWTKYIKKDLFVYCCNGLKFALNKNGKGLVTA